MREVRKLLLPQTEIIAYCLMPNHFHLMLYADDRVERQIKLGGIMIDPITNGFRKLLSGFARIHNNRYNQSGSLFRQKTKSKCLSEMFVAEYPAYSNMDYCFNCFHYIHQNPFRAGLYFATDKKVNNFFCPGCEAMGSIVASPSYTAYQLRSLIAF